MQKKVINYLSILGLVFLMACQNSNGPSTSNEEEKTTEEVTEETSTEKEDMEGTTNFGKLIEADDAVSMNDFADLVKDKDSVKVKFSAVAKDVCKKKGCWMKVQTANDELMRISFKDYGFFVPKDISGKKVVVEGIAVRDTVTVEELRHFAEDGGESEEAIAAITEPEITTSFIAEGVIILN